MKRQRVVVGLLLGLVVVASSAAAMAHGRSVSYSQWSWHDAVLRIELQLRAVDASALEPDVAGALASHVALQGCEPLAWRENAALQPGMRSFHAETRCAASNVDLAGVFGPIQGHLHIATVDGRDVVLDASQPGLSLTTQSHTPGSLTAGARHVLDGWDHLAFLVGLALMVTLGPRRERWHRGALLASGFSLGHLTAMWLATLGVSLHGPTVEMLIGASVALVALECASMLRPDVERLGLLAMTAVVVVVWQRGTASPLALLGLVVGYACYRKLCQPSQHRRAGRVPLLATLAFSATFGVIHGFGFASVVNQPGGLAKLLWFNLGVELVQLSLLALALGVFALTRKRLAPLAVVATSAAGWFWMFGRALG